MPKRLNKSSNISFRIRLNIMSLWQATMFLIYSTCLKYGYNRSYFTWALKSAVEVLHFSVFVFRGDLYMNVPELPHFEVPLNWEQLNCKVQSFLKLSSYYGTGLKTVVLHKAKFEQQQLSFRIYFLVRTFTLSEVEPFTQSA